MVFIDPYYNSHRRDLRRQVAGAAPGHRRRLRSGHRLHLAHRGHYDKEYVAERTIGFDEWQAYVLGESDGRPKTPEWAEQRERHTGPRHPRPGARVGQPRRRCSPPAASAAGAAPAARPPATSGPARWSPWPPCRAWASRAAISGPPLRARPATRVLLPRLRRGRHLGRPVEKSAAGLSARCTACSPNGTGSHPRSTLTIRPKGMAIPRLRIPEAMMHEHVEWRGKGFCGSSIESADPEVPVPGRRLSASSRCTTATADRSSAP